MRAKAASNAAQNKRGVWTEDPRQRPWLLAGGGVAEVKRAGEGNFMVVGD